MQNVEYLIIGGGVAGTTAAETIRQQDHDGSIAIISDEPYHLYSRIMLSKPNFFLEKIPFDQVWLKKEAWYGEQNIQLIAGKQVLSLDSEKKIVTLNNSDVMQYEKLLLAPGVVVRKWDISGAEKHGVFYLRTLDDARVVIAAVKTSKRAITIGSGFVSFEMCEMLRLAGIDVTLVMREPYYWYPLLDEASGRIIEKVLERGGVRIIRNAEVSEVLGTERVDGVVLKDGARLPCEMIIVGIGTFCPFDWIRSAGVAMNRGILADEHLATNVPSIWAAGDAAEFSDVVLGERIQLGNWVNAQMQGHLAGRNMCGGSEVFRMVSFYTAQGFGMSIAFVGDIRVSDDREVIVRDPQDGNSYGRLITKNGKIMGATFINRTQELGAIAKLIEKDVRVDGRVEKFADPTINLLTL